MNPLIKYRRITLSKASSYFSANKINSARNMHIQSIPMWTGSGNNYAYLVVDDETQDGMIIDPANPPEVLPVLKPQVDAGLKLKAIVNTHHHGDHAGGNMTMLKTFPAVQIVGGKDCAGVTQIPEHGEIFNFGQGIRVTALHTPCHTQDSICYFMEDGKDKVVFTGDTLFIGGCGRFFEGSAEEMHKALNVVLAGLPEETKVYPGHEYTKANMKFGVSVLSNERTERVKLYAEKNRETQGKFTIGDEKLHNVFMRPQDPIIQKVTGKSNPVDVMGALREMKNNFS